jgi:hypothetical protein
VKLGLLDEEGGDREGSTSRGGRHVPPGQRRGVERAATVGGQRAATGSTPPKWLHGGGEEGAQTEVGRLGRGCVVGG